MGGARIWASSLLVLVLVAASLVLGERNVLADVFTGPARLLGIPPGLALAIARVESGWYPWCVNIEGRDYRPKSLAEAARLARTALALGKSLDVGLMQINSYWLRKWRLPLERVLEPRVNVVLGLTILKYEMRRFGATWKAVGAYHSKNPARQKRYAQKVARALASLHKEDRGHGLKFGAAAQPFAKAGASRKQTTTSTTTVRTLQGGH